MAKFRYQHIVSSVEDKAPSASQIKKAEIAINDFNGKETLYIKNNNGEIVGFITEDAIKDLIGLEQSRAVSAETELGNIIIEFERNTVNALNELDEIKLDVSAYTPTEEVWVSGTGLNSVVLKGSSGTASGNYSVAEGYQTSATSQYSHSEGLITQANGNYGSHAEGSITIASGNWGSHAEGNTTVANGDSSHAEGNHTQASGNYGSHAEGNYTIASGQSSHAEGNFTTASGHSSHAEGNNTIANGQASHAEGSDTKADNKSEHASGQYNVSNSASTTFGDSGNTLFSVGNGTADNARHNAFEIRQNGDIYIDKGGNTILLQDELECEFWEAGSGTHALIQKGSSGLTDGDYAIAEGYQTSAGTNSHAEGISTIADSTSHAEGNGAMANSTSHAEGYKAIAMYTSHAEGYQTSAATHSHAEGDNTFAINRSHAEGDSTKATGNTSHAEGYYTRSNGAQSHAEGNWTTAAGANSHAEGKQTTSYGNTSHAEGSGTTATGAYSHTEGYGTSTINVSEHASGQFNVSSNDSATFGGSGNTLFSVGNGTADDARHNAFEIRQNGDIYIVSGGTDILLQDALGSASITVDQEISSATSASTNAVSTSAVYEKIAEDEEVWALALNQLNDDKFGYVEYDDTDHSIYFYKDSNSSTPIGTIDVTEFASTITVEQDITPSNSASTNPIATKVVAEKELVTANALNDLNTRLGAISSSAVTSMDGYVIASTAAAIAVTDTLNQAIGKLEKMIADLDARVTALGG